MQPDTVCPIEILQKAAAASSCTLKISVSYASKVPNRQRLDFQCKKDFMLGDPSRPNADFHFVLLCLSQCTVTLLEDRAPPSQEMTVATLAFLE